MSSLHNSKRHFLFVCGIGRCGRYLMLWQEKVLRRVDREPVQDTHDRAVLTNKAKQQHVQVSIRVVLVLLFLCVTRHRYQR
jgi:hypothetical protein